MENVTVDEGAGTMVFTLSLAHGIDTDIEYRANANEVAALRTRGSTTLHLFLAQVSSSLKFRHGRRRPHLS